MGKEKENTQTSKAELRRAGLSSSILSLGPLGRVCEDEQSVVSISSYPWEV